MPSDGAPPERATKIVDRATGAAGPPPEFQELAVQVELGVKAFTVLAICGLPEDARQERQAAYRAACDRFSPKAAERKLRELVGLGYVVLTTPAFHLSRLTDRGREALDKAQARSE